MAEIATRPTLNQGKSFSSLRLPMRAYLEHVGLGAKEINTSVPRVRISQEKNGTRYSYYRGKDGKVDRTALLRKGNDSASYPIGKAELSASGMVYIQKNGVTLQPVDSALHAEMIMSAFDGESEHTDTPIGMVVDTRTNRLFLACQTRGKNVKKMPFSSREKKEAASAIVKRLAALHSDGLGCGGLSPDAVVFTGKNAKISRLSGIYAFSEKDKPIFEVVATLRSLVRSGLIRGSDLNGVASVYVRHSPACRHNVQSYLSEKKISKPLHAALADMALKYAMI